MSSSQDSRASRGVPGGHDGRRWRRSDDVDFEPDQLPHEAGQPLGAAIRKPILDEDRPALDLAELAESLAERFEGAWICRA